VSDCECTEEAVEAEADGDAVGLPAVLGGLLLAGAAIFLAFCVFCKYAGAARMEVQWVDHWDGLVVVFGDAGVSRAKSPDVLLYGSQNSVSSPAVGGGDQVREACVRRFKLQKHGDCS
jgi:hypothetical protein